jgi:hypothetical protein
MLVFSLAKDEGVVVGNDTVVRVVGVRGDTVDIAIETLDDQADDPGQQWEPIEFEPEPALAERGD